jgi:hypothetical protein
MSAVDKTLVNGSLTVIQICSELSSEFSDRVVRADITMLLLDRSPQLFYKHIIHLPTFTFHDDLNR